MDINLVLINGNIDRNTFPPYIVIKVNNSANFQQIGDYIDRILNTKIILTNNYNEKLPLNLTPSVHFNINYRYPILCFSSLEIPSSQSPVATTSSNIIDVTELFNNTKDLETYAVAQKQQRASEDRYQVKRLGPFEYYAVYDGHGASGRKNTVADYTTEHLHQRIAEALSTIDYSDSNKVTSVLESTIIAFDQEMDDNNNHPPLSGGSTATILLIDREHGRMYSANLGDSRTIVFRSNKIEHETVDHEPDSEVDRIKKAGGFVTWNRVYGMLAVSRAFGDWEFKLAPNKSYSATEAPVSASPDVNVWSIEKNSYVLLTSDAPFATSTNSQDLVNVLNSSLNKNSSLTNAVNDLLNWTLDNTIHKPPTNDDTTYILVRL